MNKSTNLDELRDEFVMSGRNRFQAEDLIPDARALRRVVGMRGRNHHTLLDIKHLRLRAELEGLRFLLGFDHLGRRSENVMKISFVLLQRRKSTESLLATINLARIGLLFSVSSTVQLEVIFSSKSLATVLLIAAIRLFTAVKFFVSLHVSGCSERTFATRISACV